MWEDSRQVRLPRKIVCMKSNNLHNPAAFLGILSFTDDESSTATNSRAANEAPYDPILDVVPWWSEPQLLIAKLSIAKTPS